MPISWNEIRQRATSFSKKWSDEIQERAEAKSFWDDFFNVFGISRRTVASFEAPVRTIKGTYGYIDLFWKGMLLVEHKSLGRDLDKASSQAFDYIQALVSEGRQDEVPRYVIVSDFSRITLHDLEPEEQKDLPLFAGRRVETIEFRLSDFHRFTHHFAFIPGYKQHVFKDQDPINLRAVSLMGHLHDALEGGGYTKHDLERFLVRILFCLFAEDTGIFERDSFTLWLENHTKPDGSDLGIKLAELFEVLNTPLQNRQKNLDEALAAFPYVNGELYADRLGFAAFNSDMRNALLASTRFDWSRISPAIFGALFQGVMEPKERRQIGAHYTSERDILKVIRPLFLDDLMEEFERIKKDKNRLKEFHKKIASLTFFDPACGCGNFLVITYRELRQLEIELLTELHDKQRVLDIHELSKIDVDAFYGIEIEEWPARIAEVALWLMDHQMNIKLSEAFGQYYARLPLKKSPHIIIGNALRLDWKEILPPEKCSYILGNPPFVGKHYRTPEQRDDLIAVHIGVKAATDLDYVSAWYRKAAEYIQNTFIIVGFVSTNSITQGEQVGILWPTLFEHGIKILFAYRTFPWESEARGKAHVHVVIIGFSIFDQGKRKQIFECEISKENGKKIENVTAIFLNNISPYLVEGHDKVILKRTKPLCNVSEIRCGNKPSDGGFLLLNEEERKELILLEPKSKKYIKLYLGSEEFINGNPRWCLWLQDIPPAELKEMPHILKRVDQVRQFRLKSTAEPTRRASNKPFLFFFISQPCTHYIAIPEVSGERRSYIPIGFLEPGIIASNKLYIIDQPSVYLFGVLQSSMHMAWMRQVAGRLGSSYQYSGSIVYNTFPWPQNPDTKRVKTVEAAAQKVLDVRKKFQDEGATLADLYDPLTMPPALVKAHAELDKAVDLCYRPQPFTSELQRVQFLFNLYEQLVAPLLPATKKPTKRRVKKVLEDAS